MLNQSVFKFIETMKKAIAQEPGAGHEVGLTKKLTIAWFEDLIQMRLSAADAVPGTSAAVKTLTEDSGFVGDPKTHQVVPYTQWEKTRYPTAWLPTAGFSEKWQAFVEGTSF